MQGAGSCCQHDVSTMSARISSVARARSPALSRSLSHTHPASVGGRLVQVSGYLGAGIQGVGLRIFYLRGQERPGSQVQSMHSTRPSQECSLPLPASWHHSPSKSKMAPTPRQIREGTYQMTEGNDEGQERREQLLKGMRSGSEAGSY